MEKQDEKSTFTYSQVNIANIAIDAKKHVVGVSLPIGKRESMQITLIFSWRYSHLQQPRSPLQAGPKADAESLTKQIQQDLHHQEKK